MFWSSQVALVVKNLLANAGNVRDTVQSLGWEDPLEVGRWKWQLKSVFLLGESHEQRSLVGYSSWGCKESDMTERLRMHAV